MMMSKKKDNEPEYIDKYEKNILKEHSVIDENIFLNEYCKSSVSNNCLLRLLSHKIIFSNEKDQLKKKFSKQ